MRELIMKRLFKFSLLMMCMISAKSAVASQACNAPKSLICKDFTQVSNTDDLHYSKQIKEIEAEALKKLRSKGIHLFATGSADSKILDFNKEVNEITKKKFSNASSFLTQDSTVERIKTYLKNAIGKTIKGKININSMRKIVDQVHFMSFNQFAKIHKLNEQDESHFAYRICGKNGLNINAFATSSLTQKYIVICNGLIIKSSMSENQEEAFRNILFTLGHELGHHIDSGFFGTRVYKNFISCVEKRHGHTFERSEADKKYCATNTEEKCLEKVTKSHMNEIISDQWGIKVMNEYALEQGLAINQKEDMLFNGMNFLCGQRDSGSHPSGNHRTQVQILENFDINEMFSCQKSGLETKSCAL